MANDSVKKDDVARKQEVHFQPLKSGIEREEFFRSLFTVKKPLQIKAKKTKVTYAEVKSLNKSLLVIKHIDGPVLDAETAITMVVDTTQEKYFTHGEVIEVIKGDYVVELQKIFKMYSRPFRVPIPADTVPAQFALTDAGKVKWPKKLRVVNISTGGFALEILHESKKKLFEEGTILSGFLTVADEEPIALQARIKYCHRQKFLDSTFNLQIGCEFVRDTAVIKKVATVMNECYRQLAVPT